MDIFIISTRQEMVKLVTIDASTTLAIANICIDKDEIRTCFFPLTFTYKTNLLNPSRRVM